jgi:hypothetical protein
VKDVERASTLATDSGIKGAARDVNQTATGAKEISVNSDALEKLFEMFDLVFKAMRSLLSGRGFSSHAATVVPHAAKAESGIEVSVEGGVNSKGEPLPFAKNSERVSAGIKNVSTNADGSTDVKTAGGNNNSTVTAGKGAKVNVDADASTQVKTAGDNTSRTVIATKDSKVNVDADASTQVKTAGDHTSRSVIAAKDRNVNAYADASTQVKATGNSNKTVTVAVGEDAQVNPDGKTGAEVNAAGDTKSTSVTTGNKGNVNAGAQMKITGFSNSSSAETVGKSVQGKVGSEAQVSTSGSDAQVQVMPDGSTQVSVTPQDGKQFRVRVEAGVNVRISSEGWGENQPVSIRDITPKQSTRVTVDSQPEAEVKTISQSTAETRVGTEPKVNSESKGEQKAEVAVGAEPKVQTPPPPEHKVEVKVEAEPKVQVPPAPEHKVEVKVETEPKVQVPLTPEPQTSDKVDAEPTVEVKNPTAPRRVMNPRLEGIRA